MLFKALLKHLTDLGLLKITASLLILWGIKLTIKLLKSRSRKNYLFLLAKKVRSQRDQQIASEYTDPNTIPEEIQTLILKSSATELLSLLNQDAITSVQILQVYHSRAITLGLRYELIAQSNYVEALALAEKYDATRKATPKSERHKLPPLFGLPISIKDSFDQKGLYSTCGVAKYLENIVEEEGPIIQILKEQGAIPFIRSNVP